MAVIPANKLKTVCFNDDDFKIEWFSGTGKGGQHRNKKQNSCRVIHVPTGLIETRQGRHRESNYREAREAIIRRVNENMLNDTKNKISSNRKDMIGSGMRGDKIRTYRFKENMIFDHNSGKKAKCSKVMKGHIDLMW